MRVNGSQWVFHWRVWYLKDVSGHFEGVSRVCHGCFQGVSSVSQGHLRVLQVSFKEFQGCLKGVHECLKGVSRIF